VFIVHLSNEPVTFVGLVSVSEDPARLYSSPVFTFLKTFKLPGFGYFISFSYMKYIVFQGKTKFSIEVSSV
jgi:hypothetical protein